MMSSNYGHEGHQETQRTQRRVLCVALCVLCDPFILDRFQEFSSEEVLRCNHFIGWILVEQFLIPATGLNPHNGG